MAAPLLIADDDAVQRRLVENMVQKCGYEALVVDSGDEAVALLTTYSRHPVQKERQAQGQDAYWATYWEDDDLFYGHVLGFAPADAIEPVPLDGR